jgi:4'-phosphopantetheinyl transferase EntD
VFDGLLPATTRWATGPPTATIDDLYAVEADAVRGAVAARVAEFATGRLAARTALAALGVSPTAVPVGPRRIPQWPAGVVGSITHCAGLVAAAVGWSADWWALGIDAEPAVALEDDVRDAVTTPVERADLSGPLDATVVFCAKEAFYKCWSALDGAVLEFTDVEISFDVGRASPRASEPIGSARSFVATPAGGDPWPGRWALRDGFVVAAAWWAAGTRGGSGTTKSARGGPPTAP